MPTYEFICADCGASNEVRASIAEKESGLSPRCQSCGGTALRRAFATVGLLSGGSMQGAARSGCCGAGGCGCG